MPVQYQSPMERIRNKRAVRGNPFARENIKRASEQQLHNGSLGPDRTTIWKRASRKTMAELAIMGKLSLQEVRRALDKGYITSVVFKKTFWSGVDLTRPTADQLQMMNRYHDILF